ncbi:hypothetical protein AV521_01945 [Streptomyces sp. IMTB 2501]|nr:hypothetical protein AV521_01945 [Streptomyces sp. IMTB 2501]
MIEYGTAPRRDSAERFGGTPAVAFEAFCRQPGRHGPRYRLRADPGEAIHAERRRGARIENQAM